MPESLLAQSAPGLQYERVVVLSADDGVRRLGAVSLVLYLESVVAKLPATRGCLPVVRREQLPEGRGQDRAGLHLGQNVLYHLLGGDGE